MGCGFVICTYVQESDSIQRIHLLYGFPKTILFVGEHKEFKSSFLIVEFAIQNKNDFLREASSKV